MNSSKPNKAGVLLFLLLILALAFRFSPEARHAAPRWARAAWSWAQSQAINNPEASLFCSIAAGTVVGLVLFILFCRRIADGARRSAQRRKLARVKLVGLNYDVIDAQARIENNGPLYPDALTLRFIVELGTRDAPDVGPLNVILALKRPDGSCAQRMAHPADPSQFRRLLCVFDFADLSGFRSHIGVWKAEAILEPSGRVLGSTCINVLDVDAMIDDLEVCSLRLASMGEHAPETCPVVLNTAESIAVSATIRPRTLNPQRLPQLSAALRLAHDGRAPTRLQANRPLEFVNGAAVLSGLSIPLAGTPLALDTGPWTLFLVVGPRTIASVSFTLVSPQQVLDGLRVESFDLAAMRGHSVVSMLGSSVSLVSLESIVPAAIVVNPLPTPLLGFRITAGVYAGDEVIGYTEQHLSLPNPRNQIVMGELSIDDPRLRGSCTFFLFINDRCLAQRELRLGPKLPPVTDVQGRLAKSASSLNIDADAEAARILQDATVVNP